MNEQDLFAKMAERGIQTTPEQQQNIKRRINEVLNYEPKVGVFGKTGVGKSSLCNAMFGQDVCPISDVEACTRNPQEVRPQNYVARCPRCRRKRRTRSRVRRTLQQAPS